MGQCQTHIHTCGTGVGCNHCICQPYGAPHGWHICCYTCTTERRAHCHLEESANNQGTGIGTSLLDADRFFVQQETRSGCTCYTSCLNQPTSQPNQSTNQPTPTNQPQPTNHQPTNQPTDRPTDQSIIQSINISCPRIVTWTIAQRLESHHVLSTIMIDEWFGD